MGRRLWNVGHRMARYIKAVAVVCKHGDHHAAMRVACVRSVCARVRQINELATRIITGLQVNARGRGGGVCRWGGEGKMRWGGGVVWGNNTGINGKVNQPGGWWKKWKVQGGVGGQG